MGVRGISNTQVRCWVACPSLTASDSEHGLTRLVQFDFDRHSSTSGTHPRRRESGVQALGYYEAMGFFSSSRRTDSTQASNASAYVTTTTSTTINSAGDKSVVQTIRSRFVRLLSPFGNEARAYDTLDFCQSLLPSPIRSFSLPMAFRCSLVHPSGNVVRQEGQGTRGAASNTPLKHEECFESLAVDHLHPSSSFHSSSFLIRIPYRSQPTTEYIPATSCSKQLAEGVVLR